MLKRLYLDNCFTHHDRTFDFSRGVTGIIGPNESGKSLIVEMIRYALFGSKALRGEAADYKKLHVELDFDVNGSSYSVVRKAAKATLTRDGADLASGTKPVNEAIQNALGYDLTVFDVANACNQGNVEALSDMTPSARKAMVDRTVGLDTLDSLISLAGTEGNALKREAEAVSRSLVEPVEPEQPEGYVSSEELEPKRQDAQARVGEQNQLRGFLAQAPEAPVEPEPCTVEQSLEDLEQVQEYRKTVERNLAKLRADLRGLEPEEYSSEELDALETQWDAVEAWKQKQKLLARGYHECPKCEHQWPVADLGDLENVAETEPPAISRQEITEHRRRLGNDEKIAGLKQAISEAEATLDELPDVTEQIKQVEAYQAALAAYQRQKEAYDQYNAQLAEKQARFEELEGSAEELEQLTAQLQLARDYERDLDRYKRDSSVYEQKMEEVADLQQRSEDFLKAREIIKELKVQVKTVLLPSLNKMASFLLGQMTGGERSMIEVSEDFEIMVDGQKINTLSGSGKAVANLSVRIALGQILTNKVFSVFLADEVDAAMDDDRAEYTAQALRRLTDQVSQVVLVTHKHTRAEEIIELRK
ncbi:AAA family ATPase [Psychromarinibacter sp. C21-152]|uniref:AAA family ATPase n=1 Tax=Psychromarinibacter sediminicola TaxID=3033385 RepID=A0AAE3NS72_9RHOB|nr:AAA family ATPase [Psychromarinibacter sediminicola]MDF0603318.1 AAA family ATPase [Psychromarinibacter sediminicola]